MCLFPVDPFRNRISTILRLPSLITFDLRRRCIPVCLYRTHLMLWFGLAHLSALFIFSHLPAHSNVCFYLAAVVLVFTSALFRPCSLTPAAFTNMMYWSRVRSLSDLPEYFSLRKLIAQCIFVHNGQSVQYFFKWHLLLYVVCCISATTAKKNGSVSLHQRCVSTTEFGVSLFSLVLSLSPAVDI